MKQHVVIYANTNSPARLGWRASDGEDSTVRDAGSRADRWLRAGPGRRPREREHYLTTLIRMVVK
jgi:hypothetical protein